MNQPSDSTSPHAGEKSNSRAVVLLLAALASLGPFSIDAYLPSFHDISLRLHVPTVVVQQTITAYLIPFAAMTLWHGAFSDSFGRRRVVILMLALFVFASAGCALAPGIGTLIACRIIQGMTAGAGMIVGRAMVRDLFEGAEAHRLMSQIAVLFALSPVVAPIIGGWLQVWFGWRAVFAFATIFSAAIWIACLKWLPETLPPSQRHPLAPSTLLHGYLSVLGSPRFIAISGALTLNFGAIFIYIVSAPAFLFNILHCGETQFYWLFGPVTVGLMLGNALAGRLAKSLHASRILALAYGLMLVAAGGNVLLNLLRAPGLPWSILPLTLYMIGSALTMPGLTILALDLFPHRRGLASSCQGFIQTSGNALVTAVIAPALWATALHLSLGMLTLFLISAAILGACLHPAFARRQPLCPSAS